MNNSNLCSEHGEEIDQVVLFNGEVVAFICPKCTLYTIEIEEYKQIQKTRKIDYLNLLEQDQLQIGQLCEELKKNKGKMKQNEKEEVLEILRKYNEEIEVRIKDLKEMEFTSLDDYNSLETQIKLIVAAKIQLVNPIINTLKLQQDNISNILNQMEHRWEWQRAINYFEKKED